uniref:Rho-GAP domain-containing protein n=1 Tax=Equus caballus TaxID=9796 RepID=A0A3Q2GW36_HORSE
MVGWKIETLRKKFHVCLHAPPPSTAPRLLQLRQGGRPLTESIFRKSANMKSCRSLKETLNAGDKVNPDCESVLVVACVLKDFLRNIQGSIFTSNLYAKWLSITDGENKEEKIAATQRLLDELPRANAALLRYLFGVLHNIQQHSSVNQMTAYNLATCIAPSILCLPNACSAELESDITRKISLVQFLVENCLQIFGEDIASLLGESSMRCDGNNRWFFISGVSNNQPLESKPVRVTVTYKKAQLQNDAEAPHGVGPPSSLSAMLSVTED